MCGNVDVLGLPGKARALPDKTECQAQLKSIHHQRFLMPSKRMNLQTMPVLVFVKDCTFKEHLMFHSAVQLKSHWQKPFENKMENG